MLNKKLILRKEYFGGIFVDTKAAEFVFLNQKDYVSKTQEILNEQRLGENVKFFDATEKGVPLLENATSSPMNIFFELTKRCNGFCINCFMNANSPIWNTKEITYSEIDPIVRQFSDIGGFYIRLTGGEPTIRKDFFDIVDLINEEGIIIGLNTNGLFEESILDKILSRQIKDIRISLDGPEEINDKVRGKGTYTQITRTLENIVEYNRTVNIPIKLTINVVLMKSNMKYIEEMIELSRNYESKISFGLLRLAGRANKSEMLSPEDIIKSTSTVQHVMKKLGLPKDSVRINYDILCEDFIQKEFTPYPFDNSKCPIGSSGVSLDAFARIHPCGYFAGIEDSNWVGEDVRGKDLLDIWHNSPILNKARQVTRQICHNCDYHIVKCNGGCPMMAYVFEGNIDGRDPYCVGGVIPKMAEGLST
ncbi:MAG: radical SAM protein [Deltaproteobacteria bacterium]|nr:radical SAM protein [Deltaproteobacteria bacterium]